MASDWESMIALNSDKESNFEVLGPARDHYAEDKRKSDWTELDFQAALDQDDMPIPATKDREGYYGPHHFSYWASGLEDTRNVIAAADKYNVNLRSFFDIGCASGRIIRHVKHFKPEAEVLGSDINRLHVEWCNKHLSSDLNVFQNHSIPSLPLESNSVDVVTAFSVFTHIEAFETTWLMEIKRVLREGGIAWITIHTENTLLEMNQQWPLWNPIMNHPNINKLINDDRSFDGDRLVVRWRGDRSYSSNTFYKEKYVKSNWGKIMKVLELKRRFPRFQDVLILQKT